MSNYYKHFNGMCWPIPSSDMDGLNWKLRYSSLTEGELLVVASILSAYAELVTLPQKKRNDIIKQLRNVDDNTN